MSYEPYEEECKECEGTGRVCKDCPAYKYIKFMETEREDK